MTHHDTTPGKPAHTSGTPRGEEREKLVRASSNRYADDATGINVSDRQPIHPKMPHLPPA